MRPLHEVINELEPGLEIDLDEGDIMTDFVLVGRVVRLDSPAGRSTIITLAPKSTDDVVKSGLLSLGLTVTQEGWQLQRGSDSDD